MHVLTYFFFCKRHYVLAYFYSYIYDRWGLHMITSLSIYLSLQISYQSLSPTMEASATSKLLVSDIASIVDHVPSNYVRPISDRPNLSEIETSGESIPLIDLQELHGPNRADIIQQFSLACASYGFFQATPCLIHSSSLHCTSF